MKRLTIGVTTHNEEKTIAKLLDALSSLDQSEADIIIYDDCSTDGTRLIIEAHPAFQRSNFRAFFSNTNNGTPSVGRTYIGEHAATEYVTLIDGDDLVNVEELKKFISEAPSGYDMLITSYFMRGSVVTLGSSRGQIDIDNNSIMRLLSGIGGKVYRRSLLRDFGPDNTKGRSDDVRLNMRIISSGRRKIYNMPDICFYLIHESRKSQRASTLNFDEIATRVKHYEELQNSYPIDKRYLAALKRNLQKIIKLDAEITVDQRTRLLKKIDTIFSFDLKRIIFIGDDLNAIGGIPQRLRKTIKGSKNRDVEYYFLCLSIEADLPRTFSVTRDKETVLHMLDQWRGCDTVVITANNILKRYPDPLKRKISRFPIIYMSSAQLAFMVQDSSILADIDYVDSFRCSRIVSFSDADISFQRQLGIHGQVKGFLPVEVREQNIFDPKINGQLGYVGRIDFRTKGCERLIDVARASKSAGRPPLLLYTAREPGSPDYKRFMDLIATEGLSDHFNIILGCTDRDLIYRQISFLLLPSKKEAFGNVILEAFSYGVPVISTTYAPGPAELIEHGKTGFLLDEFTGDRVLELVQQTDTAALLEMSEAAFTKHKSYSMEAYLDFLEQIGYEVLQNFTGRNLLPVFPKLKLLSSAAANGETEPAQNLSKPMLSDISFQSDMSPRDNAARRLAPLRAQIAELERKLNARLEKMKPK